MINIAILGFGVVGSATAELIVKNQSECKALGGDEINIKYILDLRDFPNSPFKDRIVHDFSVIENDKDIDCVIEVMGGSHPAYEYTMAALNSGKHVITSNKEAVAAFGDEFLAAAEKNRVSYRFEAAVGGGIPVISPMISFMTHNKIREVRGILNGTTNYILTKMFSFGASFEDSLKDAQERGYAEKNPDADIHGTDAARKITILTSLVNGRLYDINEVHTEGITEIRKEDVKNADKLGMKIKLLGRCIVSEESVSVMVAPFMIKGSEPLASVSGVYNAVEVIGDPIGGVMFYGPGAGGGATASAVVGDLMQIMQSGVNSKAPSIRKGYSPKNFGDFTAKRYVSCDAKSDRLEAIFGKLVFIEAESETAFITEDICESDFDKMIETAKSRNIDIKSIIRLL